MSPLPFSAKAGRYVATGSSRSTATALDLLHDRDRRERLGHRRQVEDRVAPHRHLLVGGQLGLRRRRTAPPCPAASCTGDHAVPRGQHHAAGVQRAGWARAARNDRRSADIGSSGSASSRASPGVPARSRWCGKRRSSGETSVGRGRDPDPLVLAGAGACRGRQRRTRGARSQRERTRARRQPRPSRPRPRVEQVPGGACGTRPARPARRPPPRRRRRRRRSRAGPPRCPTAGRSSTAPSVSRHAKSSG